jgi:hypothetical protein
MLQNFTSNNIDLLKRELGPWNTNWKKNRHWRFTSDQNQTMVRQRYLKGTPTYYIRQRRTTQASQSFQKTDNIIDDMAFTHPVTPHNITPNKIQIHRLQTQSFCPEIQHINSSTTRRPNTSTVPPQPTIDRHRTTYISIYTTHSYEYQTFTWAVAQPHNQQVFRGTVQYTTSRKCSATRGGLIGTLQAIQFITQNSNQVQPNKKPSPIILCSKDTRILRLVRARQRHHHIRNASIGPEQELLDSIQQTAQKHQLPPLHTHHSTKHDSPTNLGTTTMTKCINLLISTTSPAPTSYAPTGPATLWHIGDEVSDNIDETIRHAAGTMDLRSYMQDKYGWTESTIDNIDWLIHSQALQTLTPTGRKKCIQYIHEWLPTCGHPGQIHIAHTHTCPLCHDHIETQDHFLSCAHNTTNWDQILSKAIMPDNDHTLHRQLNKLLLWALTNCRVTNAANIPATDARLASLIEKQHAIGWNQLLKGRWTTEWVHIYDTIHPQHGEILATRQLSSLWEALLTVWKQRCDTLHDTEKKDPSSFKIQLTPKVRALYALKQDIDHIDQQALEQPIATTLRLPIKQLKGWIKQTDAFIQQAMRRRKRRLHICTHAITRFFAPIHTQATHCHHTPPITAVAPRETQRKIPSRHSKENLRPP